MKKYFLITNSPESFGYILGIFKKKKDAIMAANKLQMYVEVHKIEWDDGELPQPQVYTKLTQVH